MDSYRFGRFHLDTRRRVLLDGESSLRLSAKLFALLLCLARSGGKPISKDELAAKVWPDEAPSDATIVQHIMLLRRLLGDSTSTRDFILTIPGRGYAFVPPVTSQPESAPARTSSEAAIDASEPVWREYMAADGYCAVGLTGSPTALKQALKHFKKALELDRSFVPAWLGVSAICAFMAYYAHVPWSAVLDEAFDASRNAIELDPHSCLAYCLQSQLHFFNWDFENALRLLEKAAELDPQSPHIGHLSAFLRNWSGDFEVAARDAKHSLTVDAGNPLTTNVYARALAGQGDYLAAIAAYSNVLEFQPSTQVTREARCEAYAANQQYDLALRDLSSLPRTAANVSRLGCIQAYCGDRLAAMRSLAELQRRSTNEYVEPHCIAQLHIALGHAAEALELAPRAIEMHDVKFPAMRKSPLLSQPMRDKRLQTALGEVGAFVRERRRALP